MLTRAARRFVEEAPVAFLPGGHGRLLGTVFPPFDARSVRKVRCYFRVVLWPDRHSAYSCIRDRKAANDMRDRKAVNIYCRIGRATTILRVLLQSRNEAARPGRTRPPLRGRGKRRAVRARLVY